MRVFSDLVITFKSGLTFVAHEAIYRDYTRSLSYGLWGAFNFDKAHSAVTSNRESLMIAESWDLNAKDKLDRMVFQGVC
jgi:hypothetical protein